MPILSLHHVTATVDDAQTDLDFCLRGLGLRLVKKTVNFDNHSVYHFYYGDRFGTPGTIWTTFPYANKGVRVGSKGAGQVTTTAFSVPTGALDSWRLRLGRHGVAVADIEPRFGEPAIAFSDPSGLDFELIATDRDDRSPWIADDLDRDAAIRGLHSVTITVRDPRPTIALMTKLLGYSVIEETNGRLRLGVNGGGPGRLVDVAHNRDVEMAVNGIGTVHHVAMAIPTEAEQLALREELIAYGCQVTEVRDRTYFKSIYFREPGHVLFEVATMAPGFTVDEDEAALGRELRLPPWEEPNRSAIASSLVDVTY